MHCQVKVQNPGHDGAWRAGRFFANGTAYRMEVVPDDRIGPVDANGNGPIIAGKLSMDHISRSGLDAVQRDTRFSVLTDGETSDSISAQVQERLKRQAREIALELQDTRAEVEGLKAQIDSLRAENERLGAELAAKGGGAGAGGGTGPEQKAGETPAGGAQKSDDADKVDGGKGGQHQGKPKGARG